MLSFLKRLSDNKNRNSLANRLRRKRFSLFVKLLEGLEKPVRVIDLGGTGLFWEQMGFAKEGNTTAEDKTSSINCEEQALLLRPGAIEIHLLNQSKQEIRHKAMISLVGDARNLQAFEDNSFDIAFSNSVIEHVGDWRDQQMMAEEMQRAGKRVFLQTPNRYFPIEPHFLFPFFQFLPFGWRVWLVRHFRLGWYERIPDRKQAERICRSMRLLTKTELQRLFPGSKIHTERFVGLAKSFIVLKDNA